MLEETTDEIRKTVAVPRKTRFNSSEAPLDP